MTSSTKGSFHREMFWNRTTRNAPGYEAHRCCPLGVCGKQCQKPCFYPHSTIRPRGRRLLLWTSMRSLGFHFINIFCTKPASTPDGSVPNLSPFFLLHKFSFCGWRRNLSIRNALHAQRCTSRSAAIIAYKQSFSNERVKVLIRKGIFAVHD